MEPVVQRTFGQGAGNVLLAGSREQLKKADRLAASCEGWVFVLFTDKLIPSAVLLPIINVMADADSDRRANRRDPGCGIIVL